jgi:hypothetical protein
LALERYHKVAGRIRQAGDKEYAKKLLGCSAAWRGTAYWKMLQHVAAGAAAKAWRHHSSFNGRKTRWDRLLHEVFEESWQEKASCTDWTSTRSAFVSRALKLCGMDFPKLSRSNRRKADAFEKTFIAKPARALDYDATNVPWARVGCESGERIMSVEVLSDSELVVNWILGKAKMTDNHYRKRVSAIQNSVESMWQEGLILPRAPWMDLFRHIYREQNTLADAAAKTAFEKRANFWEEFLAMEKLRDGHPKYVRIFTDGSHKDGLAAMGYVVLAAWNDLDMKSSEVAEHWPSFCGDFEGMAAKEKLAMPAWELLWSAGSFLGKSTIVSAELAGIEEAVRMISAIAGTSIKG